MWKLGVALAIFISGCRPDPGTQQGRRESTELHHYVLYKKSEQDYAFSNVAPPGSNIRPGSASIVPKMFRKKEPVRRLSRLDVVFDKFYSIILSLLSQEYPNWEKNAAVTKDSLPTPKLLVSLLPLAFHFSPSFDELTLVLETSFYAHPRQPLLPQGLQGAFMDPLEEGECHIVQTLTLYRSQNVEDHVNQDSRRMFLREIVQGTTIIDQRLSDCEGFSIATDGNHSVTITSTKAADGYEREHIIRRASNKVLFGGETNENVVQKSLSRSNSNGSSDTDGFVVIRPQSNSNGASRSSWSRSQRKSSTLDQ